MKYLWMVVLAAAACNDVKETPDENEELEVITTVELELTPAGGTAEVLRWADPEDDGNPVIDTITLTEGTEYSVAVRFLNELEEPAEEITTEIEDESDEHQIFYTGSSIGDIVDYSYDDSDANGLPIGLSASVTTLMTGSGDLTITLRHLPEQSGSPQKIDGLAEDVADGGFASIGGDSDITATFPITVE